MANVKQNRSNHICFSQATALEVDFFPKTCSMACNLTQLRGGSLKMLTSWRMSSSTWLQGRRGKTFLRQVGWIVTFSIETSTASSNKIFKTCEMDWSTTIAVHHLSYALQDTLPLTQKLVEDFTLLFAGWGSGFGFSAFGEC